MGAEVRDRYVLLTGAKNNAGDFLIAERAKELFAWLRPDRAVMEWSRWQPLSEEQVASINASRALILTGGPSLQPNMYPDLFPLVTDLDRITVPILAMAMGWKSPFGNRAATRAYPLTKASLGLLSRMEKAGYRSSVRDYHTESVLKSHGFENFLMTGCAALYSRSHLGSDFAAPASIRNLSYSPGVRFFESARTDQVQKSLILKLRDSLPEARLSVVFHHSTDEKRYRSTHQPNLELFEAQQGLLRWLDHQGIAHSDISGEAERMLQHYSVSDLHVGFRVHAHILMASLGRPSVLIAEDGRGAALQDVLGGVVLDASRIQPTRARRWARRLGVPANERLESAQLPQAVLEQVQREIQNGYPRIALQRERMDRHFGAMRSFLEQLP